MEHMSGAVLELGIVSRNSADIYKYREINEKKKRHTECSFEKAAFANCTLCTRRTALLL